MARKCLGLRRSHRAVKVEGYWRQTANDDSSGLPFPDARAGPWERQDELLVSLAAREAAALKNKANGFKL